MRLAPDDTKRMADIASAGCRFRDGCHPLCRCGKPPTWREPGPKGTFTLYCEPCRVKVGLKL